MVANSLVKGHIFCTTSIKLLKNPLNRDVSITVIHAFLLCISHKNVDRFNFADAGPFGEHYVNFGLRIINNENRFTKMFVDLVWDQHEL